MFPQEVKDSSGKGKYLYKMKMMVRGKLTVCNKYLQEIILKSRISGKLCPKLQLTQWDIFYQIKTKSVSDSKSWGKKYFTIREGP